MRANSLALRLFLSATVWTVLILLVTGFVLSGLYRGSVERAVVAVAPRTEKRTNVAPNRFISASAAAHCAEL